MAGDSGRVALGDLRAASDFGDLPSGLCSLLPLGSGEAVTWTDFRAAIQRALMLEEMQQRRDWSQESELPSQEEPPVVTYLTGDSTDAILDESKSGTRQLMVQCLTALDEARDWLRLWLHDLDTDASSNEMARRRHVMDILARMNPVMSEIKQIGSLRAMHEPFRGDLCDPRPSAAELQLREGLACGDEPCSKEDEIPAGWTYL